MLLVTQLTLLERSWSKRIKEIFPICAQSIPHGVHNNASYIRHPKYSGFSSSTLDSNLFRTN
jgi:hypothetical protein